MLDKEATARLQNATVGLQLCPNFERAVTLDEAECRIELKLLLEVLGERQLNFHGIGAPIVENDLLSVELLVD